MEQEKRPILIFEKNADKIANRIILPKSFVEKYGHTFYMEVYKDEIIIKPVTKEGE